MTDMPERIWTVHWNTDGAVMNGAWADTVRHFGGGVEYVRADLHRILALDVVAAGGQASDAYDAQLKAEAMAEKLAEAIKEAIDCGMVSKSSAKSGGAASHAKQVVVADMLRDTLAEYEASK